MHPTDDLHTLIKSLSKAEKRYFKLVAEMGAGRAHVHTVELFDRMDKLDTYNEDLLRKGIRNAALLQNFSTAKTRLYEMVLKSQRMLRSGISVDSRLSAVLEDMEMHFSKQLVKPARKRLLKAKALAIQFEKEAHLLKLIDWEQRFFVLDPDGDERSFYQRNEKEETDCVTRLALQRSLIRIYEQMRSMARLGHQMNRKESNQKFLALVTHPDLKKVNKNSGFLARALLLSIKGVYALAIQKNEIAWENFHDLMQLWEQNKERISEESDFYLGCFNNYLSACLESSTHYKDFIVSVKSIRQLKGLPEETRLKFDRVALFQELRARTNLGGFEGDARFMTELSEWLGRYKNRLQDSRLLVFYFNICIYYFLKSEFTSAQKWLRQILNFQATEARADIRDFARIFQLVLQFELGNLDLQEYLMRSAYRYLKRTQKLHDYEEAILQFMKLHQKTGVIDKKVTQEGFRNLLQSLQNINNNRDEAHPLGLQALIFWCESKLAGVTLKHYYAEQLKKR